MSIEQTNQLILLILNSVLMALLSAGLLGGAWLRQNTLLQQIHQVRSRYRQLTHPSASSITSSSATSIPTAFSIVENAQSAASLKSDLKTVRDQRQRLNQQYYWTHAGMLMLHVSLLIFGVSLFSLALRALLNFDGLISTALFLFTVGAASLLSGTGCVLVDLAQGNSHQDSLGKTLGKILSHTIQQWQLRSNGLIGSQRLAAPQQHSHPSKTDH